MKRILFIHVMALLCAVQSQAQNSLNSGDFSTGSWGSGQAMSASAGSSLIITKAVTTSGDKYFRFFGDGSPCGEYQPNTNGDFFTHNVAVTTPNANCGSANAWRVNVPTATSNVVFKTDGGNDGIDRSIVYVIQGAVQSVSSVAQSPVAANVFPGQAVTVTATLSGAFATGQAAYLRYTADNFATSTVVAMTGASPAATIPASVNTPGAVVRYYVFTSGNTAPASNGSDADFATINLNNNGGSNYSYTVASGWTTAAAGNWGTAATWTANAIPPTATNLGVVTINHSVTQNTAALASSIVINAAGTLTGTANTLTISNNTSGTTFTNSGTMTLSGTHAVTFAGTATHTISGTATFNNVNTTTGVNFGASSTVNGTLTLNAGGFVSSNAPTYGASSTLTYNTGGAYAAGTEWTANALTGQGVPQNVTISTASTSVNFAASTQYRRLRGNLTISASTFLALSTASGGDLRIGGNWSNSGTFTANSRAVFFDGSAAQSISAGGVSFAFLFISNTTANVTASTAITATSSLTVDANARLDMGTNALTLTGSTSTINGFLRRGGATDGALTGVSATTLTFSSTGTYEHNFTTVTGTIPTATWSAGSTCAIIGYTSTGVTINSSYGQAFSNFTWNCTGQSASINLLGILTTVNGNFNLASTGSGSITYNTNSPAAPVLTIGGNCTINASINMNNGTSTPTWLIAGNFSHTGGTISRAGSGVTTITFNKSTGTQTISQTGGSITGALVWNAGNGTSTNTVQLSTNLNLGSGAFTFNTAANATTDFQTFVVSGSGTTTAVTGATLLTANTAGINTSGATGSVQTTTRTFTNTGVNYSYNGATAQTAGTAVGAASSIANLTVNNSAGVTLSASVQSLTGTLTLTSGNLALSTFDLTLGSAATVSGAASNKYIQTNSTGQLRRTSLTSAFIFPVGNSAYNPISIANSGTSDNYGVRVVDGALANATVSTLVVNRAWVVTESVAGGSALTAIPQYNSGEEASGFNAGTTPRVGFWNGTFWSQVSATLAGSNPFTATAGAPISPSDITTGTQYFAIGKDNGLAQPSVDYTWNGTTSSDWGTSTNWTPNGVPASTDNVTISSPGTNLLSINSARSVINFTVSGTGNFTTTSSGSLTIIGTISSTTSATPSLDCASTVTINSAGSQTIPAWNFGNLDASGGARVLASTGTIGICGAFTPGAGAYTLTGSTINFNGTGAQTINAITYNNLTISGNRSAAAITLPSGTITIGGNGSCTASNATWVNTGNTVVYNAAGAQTVAAIPGYNNLTISGARGSATVTLEAGTIGVAGTFSPTATAVTYSATGNTFDYTSTGAQSIVAFNKYNNLSNSGNGARTLPTAATVVIDGVYTPTTGAITISTSTIDFSSASSQPIPSSNYYNITNSGNGARVWANSGTIDIANNFTPSTGTNTITGSTVRYSSTSAGPFSLGSITTNIAGSSYNNLVIAGSNAVPTVYRLSAGTTLGIAGTFTINSGTVRLATTASSGTINAFGDFSITGGTLSLTNSGTVTDVGTFNLQGNFSMSGGTIIRTSSVANASVNFTKSSGIQSLTYSAGTFSVSGGFGLPVNIGNGSTTNTVQFASNLTASSVVLNVLSGASVDFGTNILTSTGSMSINVQSGSTLITANTGGIATTGASGSVQSTGGRTFSASANYVYNGTSAQVTGTALTAANNLTINNTAGVTLSAAVNAVTGTLTMTNGKLTLGAFDFNMGALSSTSGGSSTSYVFTNSTGQFKRISLGSAFTYLVGNSSYNPITLTNSGTADTYGIVVADGTVPNAIDATAAVNRRWVITEGTAGGGNLSVVAQYNAGETASSYTTSSPVVVALYVPTTWISNAATMAGSDPFTATASGFTQSLPTSGTTAYFAIGNEAISLAPPTITTTVAASSITNDSASSGGQGITGSSLTAKGVVYSTAAVSTTPTLSNSVLADGGTTTANFTSNLTGLDPQTQYYVRAYATNAAGTGYASAINFRTLSNPATTQASGMSASASASGELTISWTGATYPSSGATQGGYALIYSTGTPTLSSANGNAPAAGVGTLVTITPTNLPTAPATSYVLSGLTGGTVYNFLLVPFTWDGTNAATYNYLTASAPTTTATAVSTPAITTTTAISSITSSSATSGGSGISANGGTISAKGVVWNTTTAPTTANSSTNDGTGAADFSSSLTSLSAQTLYYVRSYATNDVGTAYGNELTFYTLSSEPTAAATSFTATANGSSQIDLAWTAATFPGAGASNNGYILLSRLDSTNPSTSGITDGVAPGSLSLPSGTSLVTTITSGTTASYSNTGLLASTQYNYILVPFTWDGSNAATYNYYLTSAPTANDTTAAGLPSITTTTAASSITNNSASSGGSTLTAGGSAITAKGVAYNTTGTPTTADNTTNDGSGTADFSSSLTSLSAQTLYYVRAYVTNSAGTAYGNEITFRTLSNPATAQASGLTATASASGELTISWTGATFPSSGATQGGYALIYSTSTPTLSSGNGAAPAAGVGTLVTITPTTLPTTPSTSYVLSGLTAGTTYNFLLVPFTWDGTNATTYNYLTTSAPTASGVAVDPASVTTTAASSITESSASSGGSGISAGGGNISAKGVAWNTSASPTTANTTTSDGTGTTSFSSSLTSLSAQTLYYVRAYVTNEIGTVYGNEETFRTLSNPPTAQASGLTATASSSSNVNLTWSAATFPVSGATTTGYVLLRATSPNTPSLGNSNGAAPTAGANTTIVSSSLTGTSTSNSGLSAATTYNYLLVPFTWDGTNASTYHYLTASAPTVTATTLASAPAAQPTALVFSAVTSSTITTSWTAASGPPTGYIVLRAVGSAPDTDPVPGTSYTAGNLIGNATVVYAGTASSTGAQTGLVDATTYFYEVYSYNGGGSTINYLTASPLSGSQATSAVSAPVASAATSVTENSFTANWASVSGASGYSLDVSTNPCFATFGSSSTATEGFAGGTTAPSGWTFTSIGATYTSAGNFGAASPALTLDATADRVLTNQLSGSAASQLSFWIKGNGTNSLSALLVEGTTDGTNWVTIENITNSIPTTGTTKTYNFSSTPLLPCGMIQFRFTYTKNAGNLGLDDVSITSASSTPSFLSGYDGLSVSGTSASVTGLSAGTAYYYRVRAVGTNSTSANSNAITVTTLNDPATADYRSVGSGNYTSAATWEYNSTGSTWIAATQAPTSASNVTIQAGHTVTLDANRSINSGKTLTITGTLDAAANNISGAGIVAMGAASTIITSSATGLAGALQVSSPASCTFAQGAKFQFSGTTVNTGFASFTGITAFSFYNITWSGTTSLTLDRSIRVTTLDLTTDGLIYLGNFDMSISFSGSISGSPFSASKMIVTDGTGSLIRFISAGTGIPFTWPIGEVAGSAEYSPVSITTLAGNSATNAFIGFRVTDGAEPNNGLASNYLTRYWTYTTGNLTAGSTWSNATFGYTAGDIVGTETSLKVNAFNSATSSWTEFASSSAASNTLTFTSGASTTTLSSGNTLTGRVDPPLYYRSASSGAWGTAATWIVSTDAAFVSPAGIAATSAPTAANSVGITIMTGHSVTSSTSVSADQLVIQSGASLEMTNNALTIANGTGNDLTIESGATMLLSGTSTITISAGAALQVDGLYKVSSTSAPVVTSSGTTTISSTGTYEHARDAGIIPTCTWSTGSTCLISGTANNAPTGLGQSFHHFTVNTTLTNSVNCSGALQTINGKFKLTTNHATFGWRLTGTTNYTLAVADSLIITNGILDAASGGAIGTINANGPIVINGASSQITKSGAATIVVNSNSDLIQNAGIIEFNAGGSSNTTWNIKGNFVQGGTVQRTNGGVHTLNFNKSSGTQTWTQTTAFGTGALTINVGSSTTNTVQLLSNISLGSSAQGFNVTNGATLDMGPYVMSGASSVFTLGATGALRLGNIDGIVTSPTASGNVQTLTRTFPATASYFYTGTSNQVTGNALPATLTTTGNLNIQSATGVSVTLSASTTAPTLNLLSGLFAAGAGQNMNISNNGVINATGGDFVTGSSAGTVVALGAAAFNGNSNPYNVYTSGGINFGAQTVTIQNGGTFRINAGGFVNTNAPFYGTGSTLQYWVGSTYGRNLEWSTTTGRGYPHHVQISNNTTVNPANTAGAQANTPLRTAGNLTIDSGSNLYMDFGGNNMNEDLVVGGNLVLTGSLSGSQASGSDIFVAGNWQNDGTSANFFPNGRAVFLNGSGAQTISGTNASFPAFPFLFIDKTAGSVSLSRDIQVTELLNFSAANAANITTGANTLFVSKNTTTAIERLGSGHVIGNLRRAVTTGSNTYDYPVGDATVYAPVSLALSNVTTSGSITASTTSGDQAQIASSGLDGSKSVNRFYTLTNTGVTLAGYDPTFNFVSGDLDAGVNTSALLVGLYATSWSYPMVGTRSATSTQATGVSSFGQFALAECRTPIVYNVTGGGSYCASGSGVAVGLDGSDLGVSYQLQRNGTDIGSSVAGTGSAISFGNQTPAGSYAVVANSSASTSCSASMTGSVLVNINPVVTPAVTISATASTICDGSSVTFTATPQFGGTTPVYQWKVNGSNVGTDSDTYTTSALLNADVVTCDMTSNEACPSPTTAVSNSITMSVLPFGTPTLSIASASGTTLCLGDVISITSSATFEGNLPTYDWKLNGTSTGETGTSYSSFNLVNGDQVSCVLTSDYLCANAPTATSNTLTFTVVTPPQVDAGSNMTTCGSAAYTFGNGASNSNTTSILWTENGAGSITAGGNTLTPTYTPDPADLGTTVTFTLTGFGDSPCAEIADNVTLTISALTLYYVDADGDGFGNPLSSPIASCSPVTGRVADNTDCCDSNADVNPMSEWWADVDGDGYGSFIFATGCISGCSGFASTIPYYPGAHSGEPYAVDCNDGAASAYPGASELCGNTIDDDCDGIVDEGCSGIANDEFDNANAFQVNTSNTFYPNCVAIAGTLLNADPSPEANPANVAVGGGRDTWFRFVAPSSAARIRVVPLGFDAVIELRTAAHPVGQVDVENVNSAIGGIEIMNVSGLTAGQTYYVAVRNYNNTSGGTFSICISPLMPSGCGTAQPLSGLSLCSSFKAIYRGATSYTFRFTGTGGTAPTPFATTTATSTGLMPLSNASLALRNGGTYSVRVDANYVLPNGIGGFDSPIVIQGTPCSRSIAAAPLMEVTASQRCTATTLNRSALLRAVTTTGASSACSAIGYNFRFTRVADCAGTAMSGVTPFVVSTTGTYLSLNAAFPNGVFPLPNLGYWKVEIAPVFSYGATAYGPAQIIQVNNTGSSPMAPETGNPQERLTLSSELLSVYPNPGNGDYAVVQIDSETAITNWSVIDELGRRVEGYQVLPADANRFEIRFAQSIANGLYYISCVSSGEVRSVRWLVSR